MFFNPVVVATGVVGNPVEDDLHAEPVGFVDNLFELFDSAEFGVELAVVLDGVITTEFALPVKLGDGKHRHEPKDVDTEFFQTGQMLAKVGDR